MARLVTLALAAALLGGLAGCGSPAPAGHSGALTVVASTNVWADVASQVGGDRVRVTSIISDPAADPHSYETTASDASAVARADLVVFNGGGYDTFMDRTLQAVGTPQQHTVAAFGLRHDPTDDNEHLWYDLPTVRAVAAALAVRLAAADPAGAEVFHRNAQTLSAALDALAGQLSAIAARHRNAPVAATEPVAHYLLTAAALHDLTPPAFVDAVDAGSDPPASAVAALADLISQRRVAALVFNPQTQTPVTERAREEAIMAGTPIVETRETLPAHTGYLQWVSDEVGALARSLDGTGSPR